MKSRFRYSRSAFKVAALFFILSFCWILFSDRILYFFSDNAIRITQIQTLKGWFYVIIATIFIYILVSFQINKKNNLIQILNESYEWQNVLISNIPNITVYLFDENPGILLAKGEEFIPKATLVEDEAIDEIFTLRNETQFICFSSLKKDILLGNPVNLNFEAEEVNYKIKGCPIQDDKGEMSAGLILIINTTEYSKIVSELKVEKENYAALFKEYHAVNLELKNSYEKLLKTNKTLVDERERYKTFLQQTTEGVYRIDFKENVDVKINPELQVKKIIENGFLAEYNPVFASIYNSEPEYKFNSVELKNFIKEKYLIHYHKMIKQLLLNNYMVMNFESYEPENNGKERYFSNNMVGIIENNMLIHIWGTKINITRQKQYENELIIALKKAEDSDKLKSAFLANTSHEIRTPLNGIMGFSELLFLPDTNEEQKRKYMQIIKNCNMQLLRIIDDILDVSRIETHQLSVSESSFNLNPLIKEVEAYLQKEIEKHLKNIEIVSYLECPDGQDEIISDKQRLYQVITNLLNNAVKFTKKGTIEFGYSIANGNTLEFFVKDTGIGIPESEFESIFQQFKQVGDYTRREYGGTGLGLAIAKGIIVLLGGEISVESKENIGTIFRFTIPLKKA